MVFGTALTPFVLGKDSLCLSLLTESSGDLVLEKGSL